ncbi:MAG: hypothetical protein AB7G11_14810 [Phycisphaerales bacterium]
MVATGGALGAALMGSEGALAQEVMHTAAATTPSPGVSIVRQQFHYFRFGGNPRTGSDHVDEAEFLTTWQYGVARDTSLTISLPLVIQNTVDADVDDFDKGVRDIDFTLKYRFHRDDTAAIDTSRVALLGGVSVASGDDDDFSSQSVNPHIGLVATQVQGRQGFNEEIHYYFNTGGEREHNLGGMGPDDALRLNFDYIFRIAPGEFRSDSTGAWYFTSELNYLYETGGDHDLRISPGIMYEGRRFALEIMTQFPVYQDVEDRPKFVFGVGIGVRFTF